MILLFSFVTSLVFFCITSRKLSKQLINSTYQQPLVALGLVGIVHHQQSIRSIDAPDFYKFLVALPPERHQFISRKSFLGFHYKDVLKFGTKKNSFVIHSRGNYHRKEVSEFKLSTSLYMGFTGTIWFFSTLSHLCVSHIRSVYKAQLSESSDTRYISYNTIQEQFNTELLMYQKVFHIL